MEIIPRKDAIQTVIRPICVFCRAIFPIGGRLAGADLGSREKKAKS
jgi:hypothetical protein